MSNSVEITGNLGRNPELKYTPSGQAVVSLSVGDTPRHLDKASNTWTNGTTKWWRVEAWGQQAENIAKSFQKGDQVFVKGSLRVEEYEDRNTKEQRTSEKVVADRVMPTLNNQSVTVHKGASTGDRPTATPAPAGDDEVPF